MVFVESRWSGMSAPHGDGCVYGATRPTTPRANPKSSRIIQRGRRRVGNTVRHVRIVVYLRPCSRAPLHRLPLQH